jgi:hypothetical protein
VVSDDVLKGIAGVLAVVIVALIVLLMWWRGGPGRDGPPE